MKKIIALLLAAALALGCASALAENTKHERVYIVTNAEGVIQSLTDNIRLENTDGLDEIADVSLLTGIQNVGGKETFTQDGNALTWQAKGNDIIYEGTSDQAPAVVPVVTLTLDGEAITAAELKNKTGEAVLTVNYRLNRELPLLAVTILPLPEEGMTDIHAENAAVVSEAGQRVLVGYAAPGMDKELKLPESFTVSFHADHADLAWMMTLTSADPIALAAKEIDSHIDLDLRDTLSFVESMLTAMKKGEDLPTLKGFENLKKNLVIGKVNDFNHSLVKLNDNAQALSDGAAQIAEAAGQLKDGAAQAQTGANALGNGLNALRENNEALNAGADALLAAALKAADGQLAAAGLTVPQLTRENYAEALTAALENLDGDAAQTLTSLKAQLDETAAFADSLRAYTQGVAQAADGANELTTGLNALNDGAAALDKGAAELKKSAAKLQKDGTKKLMNEVQAAEKQLASLALPYVQKDAVKILDIYENTRDQSKNGGYDLRPEGMNAVTVYIIRTDLQ